MKKFFIIAGMLTAGAMSAQQVGSVGINSTGAKLAGATLKVDISADAETTEGQGIAMPNVTKATLNAMTGTIATSAMLYVTDVTAADGDKTKKVKAVGYHYFDGTEWLPFGGSSSGSGSSSSGDNLYSKDGTLSGARIVTQGENNLTFKNTEEGRTIIDGTFQTKGAVYAKYKDAGLPEDATSNLSDDDYILLISPTSMTQTFTFPVYGTDIAKKAKYDGRVLCLKNATGTAFSVKNIKSPGNATAVQGTSGLCYIYNGTTDAWYMFSGR